MVDLITSTLWSRGSMPTKRIISGSSVCQRYEMRMILTSLTSRTAGAESTRQAARHGSLVHETTVGERADHARHPHGRAVPVVDLAADRERHGGAHACLHAFRHGLGIPEA